MLENGAKLGPYVITGALGAGGMGEVYRARDTRLNRTVAIKVVSTSLVDRPDLHERFEREARAISKLSHPNICVLYDVGHQEGVDFLVMEYLEGETLGHRVQRGALPIEQTIGYGVEIVAALEAAHRQGVVHRDLKPGNIMLTKAGVKLMDFGLAKLTEGREPAAVSETMAASTLPTEEKSLTREGVVVGTYQYMAPEQLEGGRADARTDIFALGMVLYEMATGRPAFTGRNRAAVIAAILSSEPRPISSLQPLTPPAFDRLVKTCLAKDPEERFATAHDLRLELKWVQEAGQPTAAVEVSQGRFHRWFWIGASIVLLAALVLVATWWRSRSPRDQTMFFMAPLPFSAQDMALSPNGRTLAVIGYLESVNENVIWLYDIGARGAASVPGTEGAAYPFWSADGRQVGFFAGGQLKRVEVPGGQVQVICEASTGRGGAWNKNGVIVFAPNGAGGLFRVPASGGTPEAVSKTDPDRREMSHRWPVFLPDGNHFLYLAANFSGHPEVNAVFLASLDSNQRRMIVEASSNVAYAAPGYLLFFRDRALKAQRFDLSRFAVQGEPTTIINNVQFHPEVDRAIFAVSDSGVLSVQGFSPADQPRLLWFDRGGKQVGTLGRPSMYGNIALAPDALRAAYDSVDQDRLNINLWTVDLARGTAKRLTFDPGLDYTPVWSPDGRQLLFGSNQSLQFELVVKNSDGSGEDKRFLRSTGIVAPNDWSRDGRYILYARGTELSYFTVPQFQSKPFLQGHAVLANGQFSPDGHWVAYASNETGKWEIYVTPFPEPQGKWQVSAGGGQQPRWRGDGRELFYLSPDGKIMAVPVRADKTFDASTPVALFQAHPYQQVLSTGVFTYDVSRDGKRFLVNSLSEKTAASPVTVILNWQAELRK